MVEKKRLSLLSIISNGINVPTHFHSFKRFTNDDANAIDSLHDFAMCYTDENTIKTDTQYTLLSGID